MATKKRDTGHCANCGRPVVFVMVPRSRGRMLDPQAKHRRETEATERFLDPRWLSNTSLDDRLDELADRCRFETH